jgi:hypothetical protein
VKTVVDSSKTVSKDFSKAEMAILENKNVAVNLQNILNNAKERLKTAQKELIRNAEKHNKGLSSGELSPNKIAEYDKEKIKQEEKIDKLKTLIGKTIALKKLEESQKKDVEKIGKEKEKAEKRAKRTLKDAEAKKRKEEEKQRKLERERKLLEKKNAKIAEIKAELASTKEKLDETQIKIIKDADKYTIDLAKGNLSPNDISDYENEKTKQEERVDVLKEKIIEIEKRLNKVIEQN